MLACCYRHFHTLLLHVHYTDVIFNEYVFTSNNNNSNYQVPSNQQQQQHPKQIKNERKII